MSKTLVTVAIPVGAVVGPKGGVDRRKLARVLKAKLEGSGIDVADIIRMRQGLGTLPVDSPEAAEARRRSEEAVKPRQKPQAN